MDSNTMLTMPSARSFLVAMSSSLPEVGGGHVGGKSAKVFFGNVADAKVDFFDIARFGKVY